MMQMSERGRQLLADWEGFETTVYNDVAGKPTIGVGHLLTRSELTSGKIIIDGEKVRYADGLTKQQVLDLLSQDLDGFEQAVNDAVTVDLTQYQFDALVSFSFNVGVGAFKGSTLLKRLNQRAYDEVPGQFRRWVFSAGRRVQGLVNRRENEITLWNGDLEPEEQKRDRTMSENGRALLATWEGTELKVYNDVAGKATIGVGHLLTQSELSTGRIEIDGQPVDYTDGITKEQALALLAQDLDGFEQAVNEAVTVDLTQYQFDALVSFSFNVGTAAFENSTLLKKLNHGQYDEVPDQLRRWVFAGGRRVQGLVNRRENEVTLWNGEA